MILPPDRSLLDLQGRALVVPVNRVGVMGAGVALAVAERWPKARAHYRKVLNYNGLQIGTTATFETPDGLLIFVPTKVHWRYPSQLDWVESGLVALVKTLTASPGLGAQGVHLPALGCGLGGLAWHDVKILVDRHLGVVPVNIYRYAPRRVTPTLF